MENEVLNKISYIVKFLMTADFGVFLGIEGLTILHVMEFAFLCSVIYKITGIYFGGDKE